MAADHYEITRRLAAMPAEEKALRNRLVSEGYPLREAVILAHRAGTRRASPRRPAPSQQDLAEAVAAAVDRHETARKAAKKAAKRAAQEAADRALATRVVTEQLALAQKFSGASVGAMLSEASREDLAFAAAAALGGSRPGPARPVVEMAVDPQALSLEDLGVVATAGSAGNSPFWTGGQTAGQSPFWRGTRYGPGRG